LQQQAERLEATAPCIHRHARKGGRAQERASERARETQTTPCAHQHSTCVRACTHQRTAAAAAAAAGRACRYRWRGIPCPPGPRLAKGGDLAVVVAARAPIPSRFSLRVCLDGPRMTDDRHAPATPPPLPPPIPLLYHYANADVHHVTKLTGRRE